MNSTEIQRVLNRATEVFYSEDNQGNTVMMLAFPADQENELLKLADELKKQLKGEENYIKIDKAKTDTCDVMIVAPAFSNPVMVFDKRYTTATYEEFLLKKELEEEISLSFYIYTKEIMKTSAEISHIKATNDYDPLDVVDIAAPTYASVIIPVVGLFAVKSDDSLPNPPSFEDMSLPQVTEISSKLITENNKKKSK
ncbi:MAG: hypothetical protein EOO43_02690 [Flavobacterium sp.]|nr:MAG: hypothetical protein EOO43_02690 [Flavobacterium sp.]